MIQITYAETGSPIADQAAERWIDLLIAEHKKRPDEVLKATVCNEAVITAARLRIVQGVIATDDIQILYEGQCLLINRYGAIPGGWPDGFCDYTANLSVQILRSASDLRRKERAAAENH